MRLGAGGELRAFHADVGSAQLADDADGRAGLGGGFGDRGADRIAEGDVADDALAEEGGDAMEGAVDELVGDDEVGGLVLFFERADGGDGEDALDAELLEGVDVGAEVQLGGQDAMAAAVAGEKGDLAAFQLAENESVRGLAKGRFHGDFVHVGESGHGVKPAAADDADLRLRQCLLLFPRAIYRPARFVAGKQSSIKAGPGRRTLERRMEL